MSVFGKWEPMKIKHPIEQLIDNLEEFREFAKTCNGERAVTTLSLDVTTTNFIIEALKEKLERDK